MSLLGDATNWVRGLFGGGDDGTIRGSVQEAPQVSERAGSISSDGSGWTRTRYTDGSVSGSFWGPVTAATVATTVVATTAVVTGPHAIDDIVVAQSASCVFLAEFDDGELFAIPTGLSYSRPVVLDGVRAMAFKVGEVLTAIPSNALPASALPASAIPSNLSPGDQAVPTVGEIYERFGATAIPSNMLDPSGALPASALPASALPASALPASALPASALPASALPASGLPPAALPSAALPASALPASLRDVRSFRSDATMLTDHQLGADLTQFVDLGRSSTTFVDSDADARPAGDAKWLAAQAGAGSLASLRSCGRSLLSLGSRSVLGDRFLALGLRPIVAAPEPDEAKEGRPGPAGDYGSAASVAGGDGQPAATERRQGADDATDDPGDAAGAVSDAPSDADAAATEASGPAEDVDDGGGPGASEEAGDGSGASEKTGGGPGADPSESGSGGSDPSGEETADRDGPTITSFSTSASGIYEAAEPPCGASSFGLSVVAQDPSGVDDVTVSWRVGSRLGSLQLSPGSGGSWNGRLGGFPADTISSDSAAISLQATATDRAGNARTATTTATLFDCTPKAEAPDFPPQWTSSHAAVRLSPPRGSASSGHGGVYQVGESTNLCYSWDWSPEVDVVLLSWTDQPYDAQGNPTNGSPKVLATRSEGEPGESCGTVTFGAPAGYHVFRVEVREPSPQCEGYPYECGHKLAEAQIWVWVDG